jgi:AraC-like DNA-binding protein
VEKPLSRDHLCAQVRNLFANRDRLKTYFSQPFLSGLEPTIGTGENLAFVNRLNEFISANLHDAGLNVDGLAQMMNISRPTLYRKIRYLSKQTPNGLVKFIRLNKAAELLSTGEHKVFKIAQMVGFPSRSNFGKAFVKQFGLTPKEYIQMTKNYG